MPDSFRNANSRSLFSKTITTSFRFRRGDQANKTKREQRVVEAPRDAGRLSPV